MSDIVVGMLSLIGGTGLCHWLRWTIDGCRGAVLWIDGRGVGIDTLP